MYIGPLRWAVVKNGIKMGPHGGAKMVPKSNLNLIQNEIRTKMLRLLQKGSNSLLGAH